MPAQSPDLSSSFVMPAFTRLGAGLHLRVVDLNRQSSRQRSRPESVPTTKHAQAERS